MRICQKVMLDETSLISEMENLGREPVFFFGTASPSPFKRLRSRRDRGT